MRNGSRIAPVYFQPRFWGGVVMLLLLTSAWILSSVWSFRGGYLARSSVLAYETSFERGCLQFGRVYHYWFSRPPPSSGWDVRQAKNLAVDLFPKVYDPSYFGGPDGDMNNGSFIRIPLWIAPLAWLAFWTWWMVRRIRREEAYHRVTTGDGAGSSPWEPR